VHDKKGGAQKQFKNKHGFDAKRIQLENEKKGALEDSSQHNGSGERYLVSIEMGRKCKRAATDGFWKWGGKIRGGKY